MYVYLIETKAVHSSVFLALFYLTFHFDMVNHGGDQACADSKHVFAFTSLLVPTIAKSWAGAWERGNAFVWRTGE